MENSHFLNHISTDNIQKCPSCRSIYLTDKECEACGIQLGFDKIGEPFGAKSFYQFNKRRFERLFPADRKSANRKLLRRYHDLIEYFVTGGNDQYKIFQIELMELTRELVARKVDEEKLMSGLDVRSPLYQQIAHEIFVKSQKSSLFFRCFNFRLFGAIRLSALVVELLVLGAFIAATLAYYRIYFAIR